MTKKLSDDKSSPGRSPASPRKKPYTSPRLTEYGDFPRMTHMAKPGDLVDPKPPPNTKI